VFAVTLVLRVVWGFFGNRFSREILAVPVYMFSAKWWDGLIDQTKYYLFLKRMHVPGRGTTRWPWRPCSWGYMLPSVFMLLSGFALYGEGLGMDSWAYQWVSSWFLPMFGQSMNVHTLHRLCAWRWSSLPACTSTWCCVKTSAPTKRS
jgi:Ni/Fe-hydrogenase 1 B-type cytochrome subunit